MIYKTRGSRINKLHYQRNIYKTLIKPLFDWLIALIAFIILLPLFILISLAIKLDTKGPVFFVQERLGRYGKVFKLYKFRSMIIQNKKNAENKLYENDPRITKIGRFIRRTSIDELPQLLNILIGDMSFIGPRPPVTYFPKKIEDYNDIEFQRFLVKPGISGLAQVRCREIHDWDINIPIDVEYVQNYSLVYDLKLFLFSLLLFFKSNNIYRKD
jgi:undecaprenyl phosphate N,N'-diacetylbacillosamine 1-phosphate transferase